MKCIFDLPHVKGVRAWVLVGMEHGKPVRQGRIVAHWSDNPAGSVCQASVMVWDGSLGDLRQPSHGTLTLGAIPQGRAGGSGYCKFSAAVASALTSAGVDAHEMNSAGESAVRAWFESKGYTVMEAI